MAESSSLVVRPTGEQARRGRFTVALEQIWVLTRRSVLATWRNPGSWVPGLVFPLGISAIYTAQFARAISLPGFPEVDSFLEFILPASVMQSIAFGSTNAGTDLAKDIETGFFDRLIASPVARQSILVGRIAGSAVFAALQAAVLVVVFVIFGAGMASGPAGALAVVLVATLLSVALGGFGIALGLRTGNQEATQSTFPLVFVLIFVSSAFFPTTLMRGWYRQVAEVNPFSLIIDPTRRLVIEDWSWADLGQAAGVSVAIAVVSLGLSYRQYLWRLRAT
ncbi:MAG: ABC transporter permease [Acidimicrobiales bacterium]